jgi:hypothetical protein
MTSVNVNFINLFVGDHIDQKSYKAFFSWPRNNQHVTLYLLVLWQLEMLTAAFPMSVWLRMAQATGVLSPWLFKLKIALTDVTTTSTDSE